MCTVVRSYAISAIYRNRGSVTWPAHGARPSMRYDSPARKENEHATASALCRRQLRCNDNFRLPWVQVNERILMEELYNRQDIVCCT